MSTEERPRIGTLGVDPIEVLDVTNEVPMLFTAELPVSPYVGEGPVLIERSAHGLLSLTQACGCDGEVHDDDIILLAVDDIPALIALLQQALEAT